MKWIWSLALLAVAAACNTNNITQDNSLKKFFDAEQVEGCYGMYDNGQGHFTIYNMPRYRDSLYQPAATFDIFNSMVALGIGSIFSDTVVLPWNGTHHTSPMGDTLWQWNKSMDLREAFAINNQVFFQETALRIGRDTMQKMLDSIAYGNKKMGPSLTEFWFDNSLKIKPDEQLGLVKKLYFRQLALQNREQEIVKHLMIKETTDKYILAYKTGWGVLQNGHHLGWIVGWIEENNHPYFFVLNFESPKPVAHLNEAGLRMAKNILTEKGFFLGKK